MLFKKKNAVCFKDIAILDIALLFKCMIILFWFNIISQFYGIAFVIICRQTSMNLLLGGGVDFKPTGYLTDAHEIERVTFLLFFYVYNKF